MVKVLLQEVKNRLGELGVNLTPQDDSLIQFSIDKVTNYIKNETNQPEIPVGAYEVAVDMVIGDFLFIKYATGTLDIDNINFDITTVKSIKDGDTTVDYGDSSISPANKFNTFLSMLKHSDQDWGIWRRLRW